MKKILSMILCISIVFVISSCNSSTQSQFSEGTQDKELKYDDISKIDGLTREDYENYTIFRFDNFEGKATLKMDREDLAEGHIYYQYSLSKGILYANIDQGIYDSERSLLVAVANTSIPENSSTFYKIDEDEIAIIFFTQLPNSTHSEPVSGEVIVSFVPIE